MHAAARAGAPGIADPASLLGAMLAQQPCIQLVHTRAEDLAYLEMVVGFLRMLPDVVAEDFLQVLGAVPPCEIPSLQYAHGGQMLDLRRPHGYTSATAVSRHASRLMQG